MPPPKIPVQSRRNSEGNENRPLNQGPNYRGRVPSAAENDTFGSNHAKLCKQCVWNKENELGCYLDLGINPDFATF